LHNKFQALLAVDEEKTPDCTGIWKDGVLPEAAKKHLPKQSRQKPTARISVETLQMVEKKRRCTELKLWDEYTELERSSTTDSKGQKQSYK